MPGGLADGALLSAFAALRFHWITASGELARAGNATTMAAIAAVAASAPTRRP
jgi:hypothetical protein